MTIRRPAIIATGIAGAGLLGASMSSPPGSRRFYLLATGVAGTWAAGALGSGALPSSRPDGQRQERGHGVAVAVLTGAGAFGLCYGAARIAGHVPALDRAIRGALRYEHHGSTSVLLVASANAVAEELFFHGALWAVVADSHPVLITTLGYVAATATTRNPALMLAGAATSVLFGLERRACGSTLAPALSHLIWSLLMLRYLPPVFRAGEPGSGAAAIGRPGGPAAAAPRRRHRAVRVASARRLRTGAAGAERR